jgi:hypothetical protein
MFERRPDAADEDFFLNYCDVYETEFDLELDGRTWRASVRIDIEGSDDGTSIELHGIEAQYADSEDIDPRTLPDVERIGRRLAALTKLKIIGMHDAITEWALHKLIN